LLHEIGANLGYVYDKRDLKKLAYGPKGRQDDESPVRLFRQLAIELLTGNRSLPVSDFEKAVRWNGKFPPPPDPVSKSFDITRS
jgi:hypothetical protein